MAKTKARILNVGVNPNEILSAARLTSMQNSPNPMFKATYDQSMGLLNKHIISKNRRDMLEAKTEFNALYTKYGASYDDLSNYKDPETVLNLDAQMEEDFKKFFESNNNRAMLGEDSATVDSWVNGMRDRVTNIKDINFKKQDMAESQTVANKGVATELGRLDQIKSADTFDIEAYNQSYSTLEDYSQALIDMGVDESKVVADLSVRTANDIFDVSLKPAMESILGDARAVDPRWVNKEMEKLKATMFTEDNMGNIVEDFTSDTKIVDKEVVLGSVMSNAKAAFEKNTPDDKAMAIYAERQRVKSENETIIGQNKAILENQRYNRKQDNYMGLMQQGEAFKAYQLVSQDKSYLTRHATKAEFYSSADAQYMGIDVKGLMSKTDTSTANILSGGSINEMLATTKDLTLTADQKATAMLTTAKTEWGNDKNLAYGVIREIAAKTGFDYELLETSYEFEMGMPGVSQADVESRAQVVQADYDIKVNNANKDKFLAKYPGMAAREKVGEATSMKFEEGRQQLVDQGVKFSETDFIGVGIPLINNTDITSGDVYASGGWRGAFSAMMEGIRGPAVQAEVEAARGPQRAAAPVKPRTVQESMQILSDDVLSIYASKGITMDADQAELLTSQLNGQLVENINYKEIYSDYINQVGAADQDGTVRKANLTHEDVASAKRFYLTKVLGFGTGNKNIEFTQGAVNQGQSLQYFRDLYEEE